MICPNCQMQQPHGNLAFCIRCRCPLPSQTQGFFTKSNQTGYSRADAYSAQQRGQQPYPAQPVQQQTHRQVSYYAPPPVQQGMTRNPQPQPNIQMVYDANGNQIYVQLVYDAHGNPAYVQMIPQIVGKDAHGNPVYTMVPAPTQNMPVPQAQPQMPQPHVPVQQERKKSFLDTVSETSSKENAKFIPSQDEAPPPPVPVMPHPSQKPPAPTVPVPDRPAMRATAIASSMYTAQPPPAQQGTGSFFSRMQQQQLQKASMAYDVPVSAEELLREEADTAFVQEIPDEKTVLNRIFEGTSGEYYINPTNTKSVLIEVSPDEITSVSERTLYQSPKKLPKPQAVPEPEEKKLEKAETSKPESEPLKKLFGGKKSKEKKKSKPIIVDADKIFGETKTRSVEMMGIRVDGSDADVQKKLKEMQYGGKKSVRSMKSADQEVDVESMINDPQTSEVARRVLEGQEVKKVYDSIESAEIAKALEQLNQGIFPKKI